MIKFSLFRALLFALVLCLGTANVPAQEPQMIAPPLPDFSTAPPPDPETLAAPPAMEWEPVTASAPAQPADAPALALDVPAPQPEIELPEPPVPPTLSFVPGASGEPMEKGTGEIEVWLFRSSGTQQANGCP